MKASDLNKYDLVKNTLVLILAGGRGSRLHELTDKRAKPALYFGGNRRIIDFALSNCINSGLNRIGVVTQYAAHSLLRHYAKFVCFRTWHFNATNGTFRPAIYVIHQHHAVILFVNMVAR